MARYKNIVKKWKFDEKVDKGQGDTENENRKNQIPAPVEHLQELKGSDFDIAEHNPDISGWKIIDASGKKIGKVKGFLFDENEEKIRYLITNLKDGEILNEDKDILIPIGKAHVNADAQNVKVQSVDREKLSTIPVYRSVKSLAIEDEKNTRKAFSAIDTEEEGNYDSKNFYEHEDFNEERFFNIEKDN